MSRHSHYLIHRRNAPEDFAPAVFAERHHAGFAGGDLDRLRRGTLTGQVADFIVGGEQFINRDTTAVTCVAAFAATDGSEHFDILFVDSVEGKILRRIGERRLVTFRAMFAKSPDKSLGHDTLDRAAHEKRLNAHVDHSRKCARSVVGVQRAEHEVAGQ